MYNHQSHGGMTPQMVQMQRALMAANRPQQRTSSFMTDQLQQMNTPAEINDRRFSLGWATAPHHPAHQQRSFGFPHQQNILGFQNRSTAEHNGFAGMGQAAAALPSSHIPAVGSAAAGPSSSGGFIGNAGVRMSVFKCPECNIVKSSSEDLEIHLKTEHLNWLPFVCPLCNASRASDIQMREHMHSFHKKNENKYFYHDNPQAKKVLQEIMDKALFGASTHFHQQMARRRAADGGGNGAEMSIVAKKARLDEIGAALGCGGGTGHGGGQQRASAFRNTIGEDGGQQARQKQLQQQSSSTTGAADSADGVANGVVANIDRDERGQSIDEETDAQLNTIFGRNVKSEFDMSALDDAGDEDNSPSPQQSSMLTMPNEEDDLPDDNTHQQLDALQNVAAMFSASGGAVNDHHHNHRYAQHHHHQMGSRGSAFNRRGLQKRIVRNRPGPMTSKKRVLGECGRCHKPITAGARQMHMFFHLGKDMQTYRFRCKHPGCEVQHYRKDQMENHQSKAHGRVDPAMMDDRSQELYNLVQKMSMELLGTAGNTPGPTAAKAQQLYDQQLREAHANLGGMRRRRVMAANNSPSYTGTGGGTSSGQPTASGSSSSNFHHPHPQYRHGGVGAVPMVDSANRKLEDLECRLCHKNIMSRIRGFHILWHLNNDLGIVRYGCKYCNFKHDRPQSVVAHAAREHGDEDACEDLLYNFEDELKQMSKQCFGVERLFEKEIRRRNKLERDANRGIGDDEDGEYSQEGSDSHGGTSYHPQQNGAQIANLKVPLKLDDHRSWNGGGNKSNNEQPKEPVKKRRSLRKFGARVKSRKQKEDMIKLREVSMRLGGAQYFKKRSNEAVPCEKCGKMVSNRLSDHAYSHLERCELFRCQKCNLGHYSRETIVRHLRDFHNSSDEPPLDNRLRFAQEIKDAIRDCYPRLFVDAPIPTKEDIEKLKANLKLSNMVLVSEDEGEVSAEGDEGEEEELKEEEEGEEGSSEGREEVEEEAKDAEEGGEEEDDQTEDTEGIVGNEESGLNEDEEAVEEDEEAVEDEELMEDEEEEEVEGEDDEEDDPEYEDEEEEGEGREEGEYDEEEEDGQPEEEGKMDEDEVTKKEEGGTKPKNKAD